MIDGRLPEAVGGEFVDANGLGGVASRRAGQADRRRLHGLRRERDARAPVRRGAARRRLPRGRAAASAGCGRRPSRKLRRDQIDLYPAYDGSLLRYLVGTSPARLKAGLTRTLARIDAEPLRLSRAQNRNVFVTKTDTASRLGLARISDLARYWQTAGQ